MAQHTFMENVHRNTEDWFAVKEAVRGKSVDCPDDTPTADVAGKIEEIGGDEINIIQRTGGKLFVPNGTLELGSSCFRNYKSLVSLIIPDGVTAIRNSACSYCDNLRNIVIPLSVTTIEANFVENCYNLRNVYYRGTLDQFHEININYVGNNYLTDRKIRPNYTGDGSELPSE